MNVQTETRNSNDIFAGTLLGTAVGDALGLPREGLSPQRAQRMFGGVLRHRFVFGLGMCSDDTEHAIFTAQALLEANGDENVFAEDLAARLRWWLLGIPAGIGFATLRAILKLWIGYGPVASGVFSAGNGPAMRAPLLGAFAADDLPKLKSLVRTSTRITHNDPKAEHGVLAVALAARRGTLDGEALDRAAFFDELRREIGDAELLALLRKVEDALAANVDTASFTRQMGWEKGVSGYMYHTVPAALFCWLRSPRDFRAALSDVIALGGDADTTGAIVGGLAGATLGKSGIPPEWLAGVAEWPRSVAWMEALAERLAQCRERKAVDDCRDGLFFGPRILARNGYFALIVLGHGLRRLLPPY